jgi:hypothetical protein
MKNKTVIGAYLNDDSLIRLNSLSKKMDISRNKLLRDIVEFGLDCYEQDWKMQRGGLDDDFIKSVKIAEEMLHGKC